MKPVGSASSGTDAGPPGWLKLYSKFTALLYEMETASVVVTSSELSCALVMASEKDRVPGEKDSPFRPDKSGVEPGRLVHAVGYDLIGTVKVCPATAEV